MSKATIQKAFGAILNTWCIDIDNGSIIIDEDDKRKMIPRKLLVMFTSDKHETLSISDDISGIQFLVPFKQVQELIDTAREVNNREKN